MLEQIEKTMLELGVGFAFVGSEVPIKIDNKVLRPDLVFFNYEADDLVKSYIHFQFGNNLQCVHQFY